MAQLWCLNRCDQVLPVHSGRAGVADFNSGAWDEIGRPAFETCSFRPVQPVQWCSMASALPAGHLSRQGLGGRVVQPDPVDRSAEWRAMNRQYTPLGCFWRSVGSGKGHVRRQSPPPPKFDTYTRASPSAVPALLCF